MSSNATRSIPNANNRPFRPADPIAQLRAELAAARAEIQRLTARAEAAKQDNAELIRELDAAADGRDEAAPESERYTAADAVWADSRAAAQAAAPLSVDDRYRQSAARLRACIGG